MDREYIKIETENLGIIEIEKSEFNTWNPTPQKYIYKKGVYYLSKENHDNDTDR